jgi:hypothetical protein
MPFLPAAKGFQDPSDFRVEKAPENVFQFVLIHFFTQIVYPVFNNIIYVKRIATGINDKPVGICAQID